MNMSMNVKITYINYIHIIMYTPKIMLIHLNIIPSSKNSSCFNLPKHLAPCAPPLKNLPTREFSGILIPKGQLLHLFHDAFIDRLTVATQLLKGLVFPWCHGKDSCIGMFFFSPGCQFGSFTKNCCAIWIIGWENHLASSYISRLSHVQLASH